MTNQILLPQEFNDLPEDDQKLVAELIQSILKAERATEILLNLSNILDFSNNEELDLQSFREQYQEYLQAGSEFEIATPEIPPSNEIASSDDSSNIENSDLEITTNVIASSARRRPISRNRKTFTEFLVEESLFFRKSAEDRCDRICQNDNNSQKCKDCLKQK
ncbi:hypothetical protein [Anabaena azotica]|uniref:hypothetical protein n=1 Tax=Anabaena azotica TaxID=197653 RepID=UPI0039A4EE23